MCMFVQATISMVNTLFECMQECVFVCFCVHETLLKALQRSMAASLLWKWIVGILYLSLPPFGPWNARAYFRIMALSRYQFPWELRCSPHSALPTPSFTEVWRGRWGGKCGIQCYDEWMLMRDSYYAELIILSLHWGLFVSSGRSHSLTLWNMTRPMLCVCLCVCLGAKPTDHWSFCSN